MFDELESDYLENFEKEKDIVTGIVQRYVGKNISINLGKADGILNESEQVKGEVFKPTESIKGYILEVELEIEGKDDDASMDVEVCVVKMNGRWCIDILSTYAEMSGEKAEDVIGDLMSQLRRLMY